MPCRDDSDDCRVSDYSYCLPPQIVQLAQLEELLCSTCRVLEQKGFDFGVNPSLDKWWSKHKNEDQVKQAQEAQRKLQYDTAMKLASSKLVSQMNWDEKQLLKEVGII